MGWGPHSWVNGLNSKLVAIISNLVTTIIGDICFLETRKFIPNSLPLLSANQLSTGGYLWLDCHHRPVGS